MLDNIDSGATHRVCNDISMFAFSIVIQNVKVTLPNRVALPIVIIHYVVLSRDVKLFNVLFVTNFK